MAGCSHRPSLDSAYAQLCHLEEQDGTRRWLLCLRHKERATEGREDTSQAGAKWQESPVSVVQGGLRIALYSGLQHRPMAGEEPQQASA